MLRACLPTLGAFAAAACLLWPLTDAPSASESPGPARRGPAIEDRSCKPQGPVELELTERIRLGARVDLDLRVLPRADLLDLRWELLLPDDVTLLSGVRTGPAATARAVETREALSLSVPDDLAYRRVTLVARGVMLGHDELGAAFEEPFEVVRHLSWGQAPPPGLDVVSRDADSGALEHFIALPTAHRKGR